MDNIASVFMELSTSDNMSRLCTCTFDGTILWQKTSQSYRKSENCSKSWNQKYSHNLFSTYTFDGWILWQFTIFCKVTKLWQKWQKILTLMSQNCARRYSKKFAWIFLISWLSTIFRFSVILLFFCHKIVSSNVQVLSIPCCFFKQVTVIFMKTL